MEVDRIGIPARSRRQVMDWGLVLASQGIEAILGQSEEGWEVVVGARDYERARACLRQYQAENRGWHWQQPLPAAGVVFHWGSAGWAVVMAAIYYWSTTRFPAARQLGIMDSGAVAAGQWWRLFTAVSLHENMPHLMANVTTGFVLLGLAMARYGAGVGLLASFLAGAAGNVAGLALYSLPSREIIADSVEAMCRAHCFDGMVCIPNCDKIIPGMVMGALGLITAQSFAFWRACRSASHFWLRSLAAGVLILVLIGFSPESDIVAHVGGFVCGLLCGWALGHARAETLQGGAANLAASTAVVALLVATWHMALRAP